MWATVDSIGNSITGANINIANVANYDVTMQFSGTLDSGDIVVMELIDTSVNTISQTHTSTGENETTITINFNASSLSEWAIILSWSIFDSWLNLITWEITATTLLDITIPTFNGVTSWTIYSGDIAITFDDTNLSWATLNGVVYASWEVISTEWSYEFIVVDTVGNTTGAIFIIDKTTPTFAGVLSWAYYSGNVTLTFSDTGTINGTPINSWDTLSTDGIYTLIVIDGAGNITGAIFTIDTIPPAVNNISSGNYFSGNITPAISETHFSWATLNGVDYTNGTIITGEWNYELIITDLAGNNFAVSFTIDKTTPTFAGALSWEYYSGNVTITFSDNATIGGTSISSWDTITNEGTHILIVTDLAGNVTGAIFMIDKTEPTINNVISGTYYSGNITPSITETNYSWATLNGSNYTSGTAITTDGIYTLIIQDKAGNTTGTTFTIDKTQPTWAWTTSWTYISGNITITFTDTNISWATINGNPFSSGTIFSTEGTYICIITDLAGNSTWVTFTIDKTMPTWTGVMSWTYYNSNQAITFNDTNLSGATINGTPYTSSTPISTDGIKTFIVTDKAGSSTGTTFIIDKTAPAGISITSPTITNYWQTANTYSITRNTGTEINFWLTPIRIEFSNNGFLGWSYTSIITTGTNNNWSLSRTVNSIDTSSAQIRIIATDLAGNTAIFTGNQFKIDSTPPTSPTFIYPTWWEFLKWWSGYWVTRTWWWDNNLSAKILERSTWGSFTTIATLGDGAFSYLRTPSTSTNSSTIRLGIKYQDKWWLTSPYVQTTDFIVDSTKPTITFIDTNTNRRNYNATGTTTSWDTLAGIRSTGVLYRTDVQFDEYCNGWSTTVPVLTADGTWYIYACVQDKAGNVKTWVQMYKIDKTAPIVTMPADKRVNATTGIDITVNGDVSGISWYTRSKVSGPGTITFTTANLQDPTVSASAEWTYIVQVLVKDNANNTTTGTMQFIRDTTAPILTWSAPSVSNSTATFSFTGDEAGTINYSWSCGNGSLTTAISWRNTTTFTLANATYSTCKVQVTDVAGNSSSRLTIPSFTINYSAPSGGGGWGWWWSVIPTCTDNQLICTNGIYAKKSGISCQWGNLAKSCGTDVCIDGDYSWNPNDGLCKDPTKIEASTGIINTGTTTNTGTRTTFSSPFNKELTDAYFYGYNAKITTITDIKRANMTGILIRSHLAKMMSEYAINILGQTPNTTRKCVFSDMQNETQELQSYAIKACQLGLMGLKTDGTPADKFNPNGQVNRAIFGTTLSRALRGDKYNGGQNRYTKHLDALFEKAIITKKDKPFNRELRWYVMLMMMRSDKNITKSPYLNFTSLRGTKVFIPAKKTTSTTTQTTSTETQFLQNLNKNYQFSAGYTAGDSDIGVKYLQYFLKSQKYFTGTINGINTSATIAALFQFQLNNSIITDKNDTWAGYLGPTTRNILNPLLKTLLNP